MMDQLRRPPEGRLTDQQRALMRADLMAATQEPVRRPAGRWLAPVGVAAAVALLVGGGIAWQGNDGRSGTTGVPVAGSNSEAPSPTAPSTPSTGPGAEALADKRCGPAALDVATNDQVAMRGELTVPDVIAYDGGNTYLLAVADKWVICDDWAANSQPTVFAWHDTGDTSVTAKTFQYSTNSAGKNATQFVAGGAALPDVTGISYAFPTGDVVEATITEHMWQMVFITKLPSIEAFLTDPVVVTVTMADGSVQHFELGPEDMCAQRNHGC